MFKVLAIMGSPRKMGNTYRITKKGFFHVIPCFPRLKRQIGLFLASVLKNTHHLQSTEPDLIMVIYLVREMLYEVGR